MRGGAQHNGCPRIAQGAPVKFCSHCGGTVGLRVPEGDHLPRFVCTSCGAVHYVNPKIVTGCIPVWEDRILLCKRAIEPRLGLWTLPAGFMENDETVAQAAARETLEEAGAVVEDLSLYGVFNLPYASQVYIMLRGQLASPEYRAGAESLEVRLVREAEIPWDRMAFHVVVRTLELFLADRKRGEYLTHMADITKRLTS
jgi:ADP-ribose pyrophosphatase YjhB (NUDIX family)